MATTLGWLESYNGARLVMALVFDGVDYVACTGNSADCTELGTLFTAAGAPYSSWTTFKPGLMVAGTTSQEIQLYSPDVNADNLTFTIVDDVSDTLAGQILREGKSTGKRTYLTSSVAAGATSALTVKDTTGFASSGTVYIGHEAISYTTTTATTFGGTIGRAKWTLLQTNGGSSFAPSHLISDNVTVNATTAPAVTDYPRTWYGRFVHLMVFHEDPLTGSLCAVSDATVIWRGRIQSYRDNGDGSISLDAKSCLDLLQRPVGQEAWTADLSPIMYLGGTAGFLSFNSRVGASYASSTTIYYGSARLTAGYYSHQDVAAALNAQFEAWRSGGTFGAGDSFSINLADGGLDGSPPKYVITFRPNTTTLNKGSDVAVNVHVNVAKLMGFTAPRPETKLSGDSVVNLQMKPNSSGYATLTADEPPVAYFTMSTFQGATLWLDNASGTFLTNSPLGYGAAAGANGCVQIIGKDQDGIYAVKYEAASGSDPDRITLLGKLDLVTGEFQVLPKYIPPVGASVSSGAPVRLGEVEGPPRIRQVYYERGPAGQVLLRALLSTAGASNYNHATYDQLTPAGRGAAVPASLLDLNSWEDLDEVDAMMLVTEPKPFVEFLEPVLAATNRYVVWRAASSSVSPKIAIVRPELDQVYQQTWALTESNKAGALGGPDRTMVERVPDGLINRIVFEYGTGLSKEAKPSKIEVNDVASQTDYGRKRSVTVKCPGLSRSSVEKMAGTVAAPIIAYLSRPLCIAERTFNASLIRMAPGDSVSLTDNYVMGPRTGTRGSDVIYGWVIGTSYDWATGVGKVRVVFLPEKNPNYTGSWAPSAIVDITASNGGYDTASLTLITSANYYTPSGASADATYFEDGDKIRIYSLDEASPLLWYREVDGTPTNTGITITSGLSSPTWDATKRYVIEYDGISTCQTSQLSSAFIADDADLSTGLVSNTVPYEWGAAAIPALATGSAVYSRLMPRPNTEYDDKGQPASSHKLANVGYGLNAILNYKRNTVINQAFYNGVYIDHTGTTEKILFFQWVPLYSGYTLTLQTAVFRGLTAMCRAYVDSGCTGTIKVYTSPTPPIGTLTSFSVPGGGSESYCTFSVTGTSAAWTSEGAITSPSVGAFVNGVYGTWVTVTMKTDDAAKKVYVSNVCVVEDTID